MYKITAAIIRIYNFTVAGTSIPILSSVTLKQLATSSYLILKRLEEVRHRLSPVLRQYHLPILI